MLDIALELARRGFGLAIVGAALRLDAADYCPVVVAQRPFELKDAPCAYVRPVPPSHAYSTEMMKS